GRDAARAAHPADDRDVRAAQPEFRQEVANRVEDDVITATGAPAHLLVAGEVLRLLRLVGGRHTAGLRERSQPQIKVVRSDQVSHAFAPTPVTLASLASFVSTV